MRVVLLITIMAAVTFADLFPAREGNWWYFSYTITQGGLGSSRTDSGTVLWRIMQIMPGNASYWIKIQQRRDLVRSKTTLVTNPATIKDSLFDPARTTLDTLTLTGMYTNNGLILNNDSCVALLHEPLCAVGQCTLSTAQILYKGKTITGYIVDPLPCRGKGLSSTTCIAPKRFTQADGIGPVAFESSLSPCMEDAAIDERWTLIDHRASNRWISPDTITAGAAATLMLSTLEYTCSPDSFVKSSAIVPSPILLVYKPVYNPAADCNPHYGVTTTITYQFTAPAAGKYPVFIESQPSCSPLCAIASAIECIDTLVVKGNVAVAGRSTTFGNSKTASVRKLEGLLILNIADNFNGREARFMDARGRLLSRAYVASGKAVFNAKMLSKGRFVFVAIGNEAAWQCLVQ